MAEAKAARVTGPQAKPRPITASDIEASKQQLGLIITEIIKHRGLSYEDASKVMGTTRSRVTNLAHGQYHTISLVAMMDFLVRLGQEVTITVTPKGTRKPSRKGSPTKKVTFS